MAFRKITDAIQTNLIEQDLVDKLQAETVLGNLITTKVAGREYGWSSNYNLVSITEFGVVQYDGTDLAIPDAAVSNVSIAMNQYPIVPYYLENSDRTESALRGISGQFTTQAGTDLSIAIDADIASELFAGATAEANLGVTATPIVLDTSTKVLDYIGEFANYLKEANVTSDIAMGVPHWMQTALSKEAGTQVQNEAIAGQIQRGYITNMFGIDIYASNQLPTGVAGGLVAGEYGVVAGKRSLFTMVQGYTEVSEHTGEKRPATRYMYGQLYGRGFTNSAGWYKGVVTK